MDASPDPTNLSGPLLVVLEGIDGAGKSVQARRLADSLRERGLEVVETREPTDGPHGRAIRELAARGREEGPEGARRELELFVKDRRRHVREVVRPALERGAVVVQDRCHLSSVAYQGARGLDPGAIRARHDFVPRPDVVFLLDLPPAEALARIRNGRDGDDAPPDAFEKREILERVHAIYRSFSDPEIVRLDATRPPADLARDILAETLDLLRP